MNLLFTINKDGVEQFYVCLDSLLRFSDLEYDCYILYENVTRQQQDEIKKRYADNEHLRLRFKYIDPKLFAIFPKTIKSSSIIYYKVLAATLLPSTLDRILYLDTDVVAIRSPEGFYALDFEGNYYIACSHTRQFINRLKSYRIGATAGASYVNTGVMLMNLELLRREQSLKNIVKYIKVRKNPFLFPDQDIITVLYHDRIRYVDARIYNLSDRVLFMNLGACGGVKKALELVSKYTVFVHYCGPNKPWKREYLGLLGNYYHEVRQECREGGTCGYKKA